MTTELTDDELMARVSGGDQDAFAALFERYRRPVFAYLARLAGDRQLAEDLLQETFLRVYRERESYRPLGQFRAWLFTIARRLIIDHARSQRLVSELDAETLELAATDEPTEGRAEARALLDRLERALDALPPAHREVVLLSRFAGLDANAIAGLTGSTPGAVRVALHRALHRLRAALGEG